MPNQDRFAWIKPAVAGMVSGTVATVAIGFGWGGWMLGSAAESLAERRAASAVNAALVPLCVRRSEAHPDQLRKLMEITYAYERREFIVSKGWANMPGTTEPNRELAAACAEELSQESDT